MKKLKLHLKKKKKKGLLRRQKNMRCILKRGYGTYLENSPTWEQLSPDHATEIKNLRSNGKKYPTFEHHKIYARKAVL
jgi:hypothetical protein